MNVQLRLDWHRRCWYLVIDGRVSQTAFTHYRRAYWLRESLLREQI